MDFALLLLKLEEASGMKVVGVDGEHVGPHSNAILVLKTLQNL